MSQVFFRLSGQFASPLTKGAVPYSTVTGLPLAGAALKATVKSRRKAAFKAKRKAAKRAKVKLESVAERAPKNLLRRSFPANFGGGFKGFLKTGASVGNRQTARFHALLSVLFTQYVGSPTYILPIDLGVMTGAQARKLTAEDVLEQAAFKPWGSQVQEVLGVYALRVRKQRVILGKKRRKKAKKLREQAKKLEERARKLRKRAEKV